MTERGSLAYLEGAKTLIVKSYCLNDSEFMILLKVCDRILREQRRKEYEIAYDNKDLKINIGENINV